MSTIGMLIAVAVESVGIGALVGMLMSWRARSIRKRIVAQEIAQELLDWHQRLSLAAEHGTIDMLATMAAMLRRVEHLTGMSPACSAPPPPPQARR